MQEKTGPVSATPYAKRDHEAQGAHYLRHIDRMTVEGLHSKSAIAGELAHRDARIVELEDKAQADGEMMADMQAKIWELEAKLAQPAEPVAELAQAQDHLSMALGVIMSHRPKTGYTDNSPVAKFVAEAVEFLKDWPPAPLQKTTPPQGAPK